MRRLRAGDEHAFTLIHDRYRRALVGFARRLLRRSEHDAEDVVQDVLVAAHRALLADTRDIALRAWLHRMVRNRCIDEVRRARFGDEPLPDDDRAGDPAGDPAAVLSRRESVRLLVEDLAALPERQRAALLGREVDGLSPAEVGAELGVTAEAATMLAVRARDNLVRTREARDADCLDVRVQLQLAGERGVRPAEATRLHVQGCHGCQRYRRDLRRVNRRLQALAPPVGLAPAALLGKLFGGGGAKTAAAVGTAAVVAAGGIAVLATTVLREGEPAPFSLHGIGPYVARDVGRGDPLPRGTALVYAKVELPAGPAPTRARRIELSCPADMVVIGLAAPQRELGVGYGFDRDLTLRTRRVGIVFGRQALSAPVRARIGIVCKKPGRGGSLAFNPRLARPGEQGATVCVTRAYLLFEPGRLYKGAVTKGQRVVITRVSRSGNWLRIITDTRLTGWVEREALFCEPGGKLQFKGERR